MWEKLRPGDRPRAASAPASTSWQGRVGDWAVIDINARWKKGQTLDPDWQLRV